MVKTNLCNGAINSAPEISFISVDLLIANPKNARAHSKPQIDQISRSIQSFGFNVPILINSDHVVISGHGRLLAAKKIGFIEIPCIFIRHLSAEQVQAFAIADNRLTDNSNWDENLLAQNLKELSILDLSFNLEDIGFSMGEIDILINGISGQDIAEDYECDNALQADKSVTKQGDLWRLDNHFIFCGDSLKEESYTQVLQGRLADLVFTDPPYNVPISGHVSGKGKYKHREFPMASGEMNSQEFLDFLSISFKHLITSTKPGSIHYICMDWRHGLEMFVAGNEHYSELKNICVWAKTNAGMGSFYRSQHEFVFVFKNGKSSHKNNIQLGKFGRNRTNVWSYPGMNTFHGSDKETGLLALHPTVKPVKLVSDAILDCSSRRDIILDPFLGSGSTLVAAEQVGRICCGIELDPLYVDAAIRRWQKQTSKKATLVATDQSFDELEGLHGGKHV